MSSQLTAMSSKCSSSSYLSRSSLADRLNLSLKDLTQLMIEAGWIKQENEKKWQLTAKGEYEGGVYRQSKKYGEYIAWPKSIVEHPAIRDLDQSLITCTELATEFKLPPRLLNRLLASIGWIKAYAKGWQLTVLGRAYGGVQSEDDDSGIPFATWPRSIREHTDLLQLVTTYKAEHADNNGLSLDGRKIGLQAHCQIANWLYVQGLSFAYGFILNLPNKNRVVPDFFLPEQNLVIDYWPETMGSGELAQQFEKRELYQSYGLSFIEVRENQMSELDHQLAREFMHHGISIY